ncbi:MAG: 23S rRNA (guanosine2251-2'-O)-methyltransferase [bacterium]|jgi:23S rRNA (guanosine2251-2'-O)-methyltransferase
MGKHTGTAKHKETKEVKETKDESSFLYGISSVQQCLIHKNRPISRLLINEGSINSRPLKEILHLAKKANIPVELKNRHELGNFLKTKNHQGVALECGDIQTYSLDEFLRNPDQQDHSLIIALDLIEDPQNLGAIIRSASFLGADAIINLNKKSAPLSVAASKASAGALESFPVIEVSNLSETLQKLKKENYFVVGSALDKDAVDYQKAQLFPKTVLVVGNEGEGIRNLTKKRCDIMVKIPGESITQSLNVSVATGILLSHFIRGKA